MHVHLVGIGGSGLSAIAQVLLESGHMVSGSDRAFSPYALRLQQAGACIFLGHRAENIAGAEIVVRSSAVALDNPEILAAVQAGIPVLKRSEFLGQLTQGKVCIAIAGTHGKTTTTAMIAWMLYSLGLDPSYIIGGVSEDLGGNAHAGQGDYFVIEADEYDTAFYGLSPQIAVVTNIEHDHPDCFPTIDDYTSAFRTFIGRLRPWPGSGRSALLLACAADRNAMQMGQEALAAGQKVVFYDSPGERFPLNLRIPGAHNLRNAQAAMQVAVALGLPLERAAQALETFRGVGRRFEVRGEAAGVTVIDDYAHHPSEIRATLAAARERYPSQRIWTVWQPHTFSRTIQLFDAFTEAFGESDCVVVTGIYAAREPQPEPGSREETAPARLASAISAVDLSQAGGKAIHLSRLDQVQQYLLERLVPGDVVLVLSAGDADTVSTNVLRSLKTRQTEQIRHPLPRFSAETALALRNLFGVNLQFNVPLGRWTSARLGGPADALLVVHSAQELAAAVRFMWEHDLPYKILGAGSNVLVSDQGMRGVVIINQARRVEFDAKKSCVWAETGANLGSLARQAGRLGYTGLEWAAGIPGTLGGALVGNAGAHGSDLASNLIMAEILHQEMQEQAQTWTVDRFDFAYRTSVFKKTGGAQLVALSAVLQVAIPEPEKVGAIQARMDELAAQRRRTQPPGASMGSMFKNPPGDYAGRLIEAAGLKGVRVGGAEISQLHANFMINRNNACAEDYRNLIEMAQKAVKDKFGIELNLEVELVGEW